MSQIKLGNGNWESTVYNSRMQPEQIALGSSQNATNLLKLNFTYGGQYNNGNVWTQTIDAPTVGNNVGFTADHTYEYDTLNRIKMAKEIIGGGQSWKQTFDYDRYGNRQFDTANTTTLGSCNPNVCNPTISQTNNQINASGYSYDAAGNMKNDAELRDFTYDGENKQTKVIKMGATLGEYFYDGDGKRVKVISTPAGQPTQTTIFVYDASSKLVAEYSDTPATGTDAKVSYTTSDHLGSPRVLTDANGGVISRRDFMPFGEEIKTSQRTAGLHYTEDKVRQKFTSYERDIETDLDFAQSRYFNYGHGRFSSPDSFTNDTHTSSPQSWNLYAYVKNNPLNIVDPLGKKGEVRYWTDSNGVVQVRLKATFAIYGANGQNVSRKDLKQFEKQFLGGIRDLLKGTFNVEGRTFMVKADVSAKIVSSESAAIGKGKDNIVEVGYQNLFSIEDDGTKNTNAAGIGFGVEGESFDRVAIEIRGEDGNFRGLGRYPDDIRGTSAHEFAAHLLHALHGGTQDSLFYGEDSGNEFQRIDLIRLMLNGNQIVDPPPPLPGQSAMPRPFEELGSSGRMMRSANNRNNENPSAVYGWQPNR